MRRAMGWKDLRRGALWLCVCAGALSLGTATAAAAPPLGSASFEFSPAAPDVGQTVTFTSTSRSSEGSIDALDWDLDGDGDFDDFNGSPATWSFRSPGAYDVGLQVTDSDGVVDTAREQIEVLLADLEDEDEDKDEGEDEHEDEHEEEDEDADKHKDKDKGKDDDDDDEDTAPANPTGPSDRPAARRLRVMSPFPVVRIAGTVLPRGAHVRILSVRAPRRSLVRLRCKGEGCPVGSVARTSATRVVRFRKFERRLPAGVRLKLFVRQANRIGKYTSFRIRAGAPPKRVDLCLLPGRGPRRCP